MRLPQGVDVGPVRCGWAAVEETGGRQRQRAGAYREYLRTLAVLRDDPIQDELVVARLQGGNDDIVGTIRIALVESAGG